MVDTWVQNSQNWLNLHYGGVSGFNLVDPNGITGWNTMYAITRALQHELGITTLSDNFGSATLAALTAQFPTISIATQAARPNVAALIQCALWCKGYWGGVNFGTWDSSTVAAVGQVNTDIGLGYAETFSPKVVKSLLTMDAYIVVNSGSSDIRAVQQWLNAHYLSRRDFYVIPSDGHFSRGVQQGLMYAIQYELGMADGTANGSFGPATQSGLQTSGVFGVGHSDSSNHLVRLFQGALRFNTYAAPFSGTFDTSTSVTTSQFQGFAALSNTGAANYQTWASLLVSTGDPNRSVAAFDTDTPLTTSTAASLYSAGYRTVGRYLNGTTKQIRVGEIKTILAAGLSLVPVYEEFNNADSYFTTATGQAQGYAAVRRARQLGIIGGATLYFPVDYDPTDDEITAVVIPYFQGVAQGVATMTNTFNRFVVGVYGTRNVCARIVAAGLATSPWVAGMSTGWSGNLGFRLPAGWAYDQIAGTTVAGVVIDKDVKSATAPSVQSNQVLDTPTQVISGATSYNSFFWWLVALDHAAEAAILSQGDLNSSPIDLVTRLMLKPKYATPQFDAFIGPPASVSRATFESTADAPPSTISYSGYDHLAVSARFYIHFGNAGGSSSVQQSDIGGWAFDLASLWLTYAAQRRAGTYTAGVYQWMYTKVGNSSNFGIADLIADVDGFIAGYDYSLDATRPFSDMMREILYQTQLDPRWRFSRYYGQRFGANVTTARAAAKDVFTTSNWLIWAQYNLLFNSERRPGTTSGNPADPSGAELASELDDLARGFVDRILDFVNVLNPGPTS